MNLEKPALKGERLLSLALLFYFDDLVPAMPAG